MRCPDRNLLRIPHQNIVMITDGDLNRSVPPGFSRMNTAAKLSRDDMKPKTDPKDREPDIQVLNTYPGPLDRRSATKNNAPVRCSDLLFRGRIGDQHHIDIQISQGTVYQMVELPIVVDHANREHCYRSL